MFENARDICRVSTKFEAVERETLVDFFFSELVVSNFFLSSFFFVSPLISLFPSSLEGRNAVRYELGNYTDPTFAK